MIDTCNRPNAVRMASGWHPGCLLRTEALLLAMNAAEGALAKLKKHFSRPVNYKLPLPIAGLNKSGLRGSESEERWPKNFGGEFRFGSQGAANTVDSAAERSDARISSVFIDAPH